MVEVKGINDFTLVRRTLNYSADKGWVTTFYFQGPPDATLAKAKCESLKEQGATSISYDTSLPNQIVAEFPDQQAFTGDSEKNLPPVNQDEDFPEDEASNWQLIPFDLEKDLRSHPVWNQSAMQPGTLELIDQAIREGRAGDVDWAAEYPATLYLNAYVAHRLKGVNSYLRFHYIIRHTREYILEAAFRVDFGGRPKFRVGNVLTFDQIGVPPQLKWAEPKFREYDPNLQKWVDTPLRWLVKAPSVTFDENKRKYVVTREYLGAESFSAVLYENGNNKNMGELVVLP